MPYSFGFTRKYIVDRAMENVSNATLTTIANHRLNIILQQLYTNYQWDFLIKRVTLQFSAGAANPVDGLPLDYRSHIDLRYVDTSQTPNIYSPVWYIEPEKYLMIRDPAASSTKPDLFTVFPTWSMPVSVQTDPQSVATKFAVYPTMVNGGSLVLLYEYLPCTIDATAGGDNVIPVFPDHSFLIDYLTNELYEYLRDPRYNKRFVEETIHRVRQNFSDQGMNARQLRLDRRIFRPWVKNFGNIFDPWR